MMKSLIERYVTQRVLEYGGVEVETPIMYDFEHPALASYLNRFPARQYLVKSDEKEYFLQIFRVLWAVPDGKRSIAHVQASSAETLRAHTLFIQAGEEWRARGTETAPCVSRCLIATRLCETWIRRKKSFPKRFELSQSVLKEIGFSDTDYELAIRFTEDFYNQNKEFIASIIRKHGRPALVEMWKERFFYFVLKWEFNFIDNLDKASALSTDQIDIENAQRYGITFRRRIWKEGDSTNFAQFSIRRD